MEEKVLPLISVEFSLEGDEFDLCSVTNALGVLPSRTCTKEDWPDSIKNNAANLPSEIRPRTIWELDTPKVTSKSVSEQCEILMNIFKGKEGIVNKLRERYNLKKNSSYQNKSRPNMGGFCYVCLDYSANLENDIPGVALERMLILLVTFSRLPIENT